MRTGTPRGMNEAARPAKARAISGRNASAVWRKILPVVRSTGVRKGAVSQAMPPSLKARSRMALGFKTTRTSRPARDSANVRLTKKVSAPPTDAPAITVRIFSGMDPALRSGEEYDGASRLGNHLPIAPRRSTSHFMVYASVLDNRAVIAVNGAEARDFLQGLITNDMEACGETRAI